MRSRTTLALVLVLLAVGVVATIASIGGGGDGPAALDSSLEGREATASDELDVALDAAREQSAAASDRRVPIVEDAPVADLVLDDVTLGFVVRCVDAATGAPIAGAHVYLSDRELPGTLPDGFHPAPIEALIEHREPVIANASGEVRLPPPLTFGLLAAVDKERRAARFVGPPLFEGVIELRLEPRRDLVVEVRHADGSPASGFEVVTLLWVEDEAGNETYNGTNRRTTTDTRGTATFEWSALTAQAKWRHVLRGQVRVELVSSAPTVADFEARKAPDEPLRLVLPPMGRVVVEVVVASVRARGVTRVALGTEGAGVTGLRLEPVIDGRAVFHVAANGQRFRAELGPSNQSMESGSGYVPGPTQHGEEVTIVLDRAAVRIVGRLVDESGGPIVNTRFEARTLDMGRRPNRFETDGDGWFSGAPIEFSGLEHESTGCVEWTFDDQRPGEPLRRGTVLVPIFELKDLKTLAPHECDVGEVVMFEAPLLVSGVVIDPLGRPVPNVETQVGVRDETILDSVQGDISEWSSIASAWTDASGRFWVALEDDLLESPSDRTLSVVVASRAHATVEPVQFEIGDEVTVVVEGLARIEGQVVVNGEHAFDRFVVVATAEHDPKVNWFSPYITPDDEGRFQCAVPAGTWSLQLNGHFGGGFGAGFVERLARVDGIEVRANERVRPPELNPWPIAVQEQVVRVVGPDGLPISSGHVTFIHADRGTTSGRILGGSFRLHASSKPVDAWINVQDCASVFVRDVRSHLLIALGPSPSIDVDLRAPDLELPAGAQLGLRLDFDRPYEGGGTMNTSLTWDDGADGFQHQFDRLHAAGEWSTRLFVRRDSTSPALEFGKAHTVVVFGGIADQETSITLDGDEVAEALRLLEEQDR